MKNLGLMTDTDQYIFLRKILYNLKYVYIYELYSYERDIITALENYKKHPYKELFKQIVLEAVADTLEAYYNDFYNYDCEDEQSEDK